MNIPRKLFGSLRYSLQGVRWALSDASFRLELYAFPSYVLFIWILWPRLESWEILFLLLSYVLILMAELLNTTIEFLLERLHPEYDSLVGKAKDTASAAVFLAIVFSLFVAGTIAYRHII